MAEGLLVIGPGGGVLVYNRPAEEMLGLSPGSLSVGASLAGAAPVPALLDAIRHQQHAAEATAEERVIEIDPRRAVRVSLARLPATADGAPPSVLVVLYDMRETERLQSLRREFVANVSHEVRTPLAAIRGYSATLLAGALDDHQRARRFLEVIDQQAERLGQLVDDLSRLADLEQGRVELQRRRVAVPAVVEEAVGACRDLALRAGVNLALSVPLDTPPVMGDRDLLEQALVRLIDNAIRYTPPGGSVSISAAGAPAGCDAARAHQVQFTVVDTGAGVPPQDLPRQSERFYRVDKGRSRGQGGSGLGLAIVKHIVQAHQGAMRIDSELQRGTSVTVLWPAYCAGGREAPAGRDTRLPGVIR
jgi:two-component system phosphate regulon sensor histidine kinase PhoR